MIKETRIFKKCKDWYIRFEISHLKFQWSLTNTSTQHASLWNRKKSSHFWNKKIHIYNISKRYESFRIFIEIQSEKWRFETRLIIRFRFLLSSRKLLKLPSGQPFDALGAIWINEIRKQFSAFTISVEISAEGAVRV